MKTISGREFNWIASNYNKFCLLRFSSRLCVESFTNYPYRYTYLPGYTIQVIKIGIVSRKGGEWWTPGSLNLCYKTFENSQMRCKFYSTFATLCLWKNRNFPVPRVGWQAENDLRIKPTLCTLILQYLCNQY